MPRSLAIALFLPGLLGGCIHSEPHDDGGVPTELDIQDPDPDQEPAGPKFCNPTGKQGEDLRKCYEQNEGIYRSFDEEAKKREPWFNFTPASWAASTEVDAKYILPVVKEDEAIKKLESAPYVELTSSDVAHFTGKSTTFPGMKPYLVRALMYYPETGSFSVFERDQAIYVRHDSVGSSTPAEKRAAIVVFRPFKPKEVYVDCQVTE